METALIAQLKAHGLDQATSEGLVHQLALYTKEHSTPPKIWQAISKILVDSKYDFGIHLAIFNALFPDWHVHPESAAAWLPDENETNQTNLAKMMKALSLSSVSDFHRFTREKQEAFWQAMLDKLHIVFDQAPNKICDLSKGAKNPNWFPNAKMNIINSCFTASPDAIAIHYLEQGKMKRLTYAELDRLVNRIANGLIEQGLKADDAVGIAMPLTHFAVAIYLAVIKMGGVVVSIADSFSSQEMAVRLQIANTKVVFTQDAILWGDKKLPLYEKVVAAHTGPIIVLPSRGDSAVTLRKIDFDWKTFLSQNEIFKAVPCEPMAACNILFSSGTTAAPKAIAWNHTTPIKSGSDAYLHHDIKPQDVLCWPTNLGWMMGPWVIFAALLNQASLAIYADAPKDRPFGEFIEKAGVTMLGLVPTLVALWRQSKCMENLNWQNIKAFSSTGECSNPEDMLYLMSLAGYKPIIEYCGGTEIGGAYISSTLLQPNCPSLFTTPAMGSDFVIINDAGELADEGDVALISPALGLSTTLLNADHEKVYFADMPSPNGLLLRRHGDQLKRYANGYFSIQGRSDDAMKLGGIKISAAEIERTIIGIPEITEVAAVAIVPPQNGPSWLVIYATTLHLDLDKKIMIKEMQKRINTALNPLFKIHDLIFIKELPKTASNKIMRRTLRKQYLDEICSTLNNK